MSKRTRSPDGTVCHGQHVRRTLTAEDRADIHVLTWGQGLHVPVRPLPWQVIEEPTARPEGRLTYAGLTMPPPGTLTRIDSGFVTGLFHVIRRPESPPETS